MPALLLVSLLLSPFVVSAAPPILRAIRPAVVYDDSRPGLNSDKKRKLQVIAADQAVNPSFFLQPGERVKLLSSDQFDTREVMADLKTGEALKEMKVVYRCALAEVLDGPNTGKRGWIVLSREVVDRYQDNWYEAVKE